MNNTNILKVFIKFLKSNNAYEEFLYNLKNQICYRCDDYKHPAYYVKNIICQKPQMIINYAFGWCDTKEEHKFWYNLHCKWLKTCEIYGIY